jgi:LacI family transcriptional regulator
LENKEKMVTIRDLARRLNLSITTISRALDGYDDVAEDTRQLVIQTAQEMGYAPNRAARQLRRRRSDSIGYILPASKPQFSDPFFSELIAGLGDGLAESEYDLLVSAAPPGSDRERLLYQRWVQGRKVDGFVLNRMRLYDWRVQYLAQQGVPFVSLERSLDPVDAVCIEIDTQAGMAELMAHLLELGHRRIAYIGASAQLKIQADRLAGYQRGLAQAGCAIDPALMMEGDLTPAVGYQIARHLLDLPDPPTAIVCINDLTAFGVLHAAHERGLRFGHELAVTGFDGIQDAAHTEPPLTTLNQPVYDIACQLIQMLLALIGQQPIETRGVLIHPELLVRPSTTG